VIIIAGVTSSKNVNIFKRLTKSMSWMSGAGKSTKSPPSKKLSCVALPCASCASSSSSAQDTELSAASLRAYSILPLRQLDSLTSFSINFTMCQTSEASEEDKQVLVNFDHHPPRNENITSRRLSLPSPSSFRPLVPFFRVDFSSFTASLLLMRSSNISNSSEDQPVIGSPCMFLLSSVPGSRKSLLMVASSDLTQRCSRKKGASL
jgi:hypothetical protein